MNGFTFNSIHSSTKDIKAIKTEGRPTVVPRKHKFIEIPYRSSAYLIPDNSKADIQISIECLFESDDSIYQIARGLDSWLNQSNWKPLKFDDDPNYYYLAMLIDSNPIEDPKQKKMKFTFRCKPDALIVEGNNNG